MGGYFASSADAETFEAELSYLLVHQHAAFNSPVWFNCGLYQRYGITGSGGNFAWAPEVNDIFETANAYQNPQCSACFIQKVDDDLMKIYDLVKNEARLFKYGSGTGSNFSAIRGHQEKLSGGGTSSGLMSFLEVLDRAAGATKSGGTTRRAAKMVCLDMEHPEIVDFIQWKMKEERKAFALIEAGYSSDFNGDAYHTIAGQNSNNSVRVTDAFMRAVETDGEWRTYFRTTGQVANTYKARDLWRMIGDSAWGCADPGVQYDSTINDWHTCPNTERINASNPCSEYMFLDDSACNLSSINLTKYLDDDGHFDIEAYRHTVRILIQAQEILCVDYSALPHPHDRAEQSRLPAARSRLRQPRHLADAARHPVRQPAGSRDVRCVDRDHDRRSVSDVSRDRRCQGRVPRLRTQPSTDAARDEHASCSRQRHLGSRSGGLWTRSRPTFRKTCWMPPATAGMKPSRSASATATATRRRPCSRRPARSAS